MSNLKELYALVAQLDRVFGYEPKGRGFESRRAYQTKSAFVRRRIFVCIIHFSLFTIHYSFGVKRILNE